MRKTSVYLTETASRRLAELARLEGRSQAEVLRDAIGSYSPASSPDRSFLMAGCAAGPGESIADIGEEELLEGFGA